MPLNRRALRAFTVIELLVVVAIIALLISILLPSLSAAREHAKEAACGATLRIFGQGLANYNYVSNDWLPGMNTSGVATSALKSSDSEHLQKPDVPVQPHDWMTPLLYGPNHLPSKRPERFAELLNTYGCPSTAAVSAIFYPGSNVSSEEEEDFNRIGAWRSTSYLMPAAFQLWGDSHKKEVVAPFRINPGLKVYAKTPPENWEYDLGGYQSRLNQIGSPGRKVFAADGTRYLDSNQILDFDISPFPTYFGAFTSSGAWWRGSTAYGPNRTAPNWDEEPGSLGSPSEGKNLSLTYRHSNFSPTATDATENKGMMNALFFDGHVELMNDRDSRKVELWYPRGTRIKNPDQGMMRLPGSSDSFLVP